METYIVTVNGVSYEVQVEKKNGSAAPVAAAPSPAAPAPAAKPVSSAAKGAVKIECKAAGKVWKIVSKEGQPVKKGDQLMILEAMKMEIPVVAEADGTIATLEVSEGQAVEAGDLLATIK